MNVNDGNVQGVPGVSGALARHRGAHELHAAPNVPNRSCGHDTGCGRSDCRAGGESGDIGTTAKYGGHPSLT